MIRLLILLLLWAVSSPDSPAQQFPNISITHIGTEEGLQSSVVYNTIVDNRGLVWLCTYDGLYQYDGYRARKITVRTCDTCPPVNIGIYSFLPVSLTEGWILCSYGLGKLNPVTGLFNIVIPSAKTENYISINELNDSLITLTGVWKRPCIINRYTQQFVWFGQKSDIYPLGKISKEVTLQSVQGFPGTFKLLPFNTFYKQLPGTLKFISAKAPADYQEKTNDITSISLPGGVSLYYGDGDDFGHPDIETYFDIRDSLHQSVFKGADPTYRERFLSFNPIVDDVGNAWFLSSQGFICLPAFGSGLVEIASRYPALKNLNVSAFLKIGREIWVITRGQGIFIIHPQQNFFRNLDPNSQPGALAMNFVLQLFPAEKNRLLIKHEFNYNAKATLLDLKTMQTTIFEARKLMPAEEFSVKKQPPPFSPGFYASVDSFKKVMQSGYQESSGQTYIGSGMAGLYYKLEPSGKLSQWPGGKELINQITIITSKYQGDTLWFGTESVGLAALHLPTGKTEQYQPQSDAKKGPAHNRIHGLCFDATGNLWLATSAGLSYFNKKTKIFTHFNKGLCHPVIYNITMDRQGMLWLGTGNGLSRFDTSAKTFTNFFSSNGLINSEYNRNSAYMTEDGLIFMGGTRGIDYFNPAAVVVNPVEMTPLITMVSLPGKALNPQENRRLAPTENTLFFSFSAAPILEAKNCTYLYRLAVNKEGKWEKLTTGHELQFANLSPGHYTLNLKTINQNGELSRTTASFSFFITKPWYQTWAFLIAVSVILLSALYLLVSYSQKQKLVKLEQQNEILRLKTEQLAAIFKERERITADLHDDVGATLSSLNIYGDLAHAIWEANPEKSKEMVGKIAGQSRELMQRMSDIIWSMKEGVNGTGGFTPRIRNFAQELLSGKNIVLNMDIDEPLLGTITNPMVRKNIILIIKEALNNAAKYSGATEAGISVFRQEGFLVITIRDNGKGFEIAHVQEGNGLENMAARCRQMGGNIEVHSEPGNGTAISCKVPIAIISYPSNK